MLTVVTQGLIFLTFEEILILRDANCVMPFNLLIKHLVTYFTSVCDNIRRIPDLFDIKFDIIEW